MVLDLVTIGLVLRTVRPGAVRDVPIGLIRVLSPVLRVVRNVEAERVGARWVTLLGDVRNVRGAIVLVGTDRIVDRGIDLCTDRVGGRDIVRVGARDIVRVGARDIVRVGARDIDRAGAERAGAERTDRAPPMDRTR